jgi:hypothetical protein
MAGIGIQRVAAIGWGTPSPQANPAVAGHPTVRIDDRRGLRRAIAPAYQGAMIHTEDYRA